MRDGTSDGIRRTFRWLAAIVGLGSAVLMAPPGIEVGRVFLAETYDRWTSELLWRFLAMWPDAAWRAVGTVGGPPTDEARGALPVHGIVLIDNEHCAITEPSERTWMYASVLVAAPVLAVVLAWTLGRSWLWWLIGSIAMPPSLLVLAGSEPRDWRWTPAEEAVRWRDGIVSVFRRWRASAAFIALAGVLVVKEVALLDWLATPGQWKQAERTIYSTAPAHFSLAVLLGLVNVGVGAILLRQLETIFGKDSRLLALLGVAGIFTGLWLGSREARTVCELLGWEHTGWVVFGR